MSFDRPILLLTLLVIPLAIEHVMSEMSADFGSTRARLETEILRAATAAAPRVQMIAAPRGAGKSTALARIETAARRAGSLAARIDFETICTIPTQFARYLSSGLDAAARACGSAPGPRAAHLKAALDEESARRKPDFVLLLDLSFAYPQAVAEDSGRSLLLFADEIGEVRGLQRHSGLRDCLRLVARRLATSGTVSIVGTLSPASRPGRFLDLLRSEAGADLRVVPWPPLARAELAEMLAARGCSDASTAGDGLSMWMKVCGGRPLYAEILAQRVARGEALATALSQAMRPPTGALHQECRFDYHLLVERSRGHAAVRTILDLLARRPGLNLTGIAHHLRIAPPTALDYLSWLLEVQLIRRDGSGYVCDDPLLRLWVVLNGPQPVDPAVEIARFLEEPLVAPLPPPAPRGRRPGARLPEARPIAPLSPPSEHVAPQEPQTSRAQDDESTREAPRHDLLMEID